MGGLRGAIWGPNRSKIAPWGSFGGPWGAPGTMCETVAFNVPPEISKNRLLGPRRAQKDPKGPPKKFIEPTRRPRKRHLGVFWPPKTPNEKKKGHFWGAFGARCTFSFRKNDDRQNTPLGPQGALGGAFGPSGGPSGPLSKFWGALGTARFGLWGAQGRPQVRAKKTKATFGATSGAPTYVCLK